ncbi:MAG TPA: chaperone modulator CbpM [Candidatus Acidoferrum sp.]|nr:chaperone modulator CbpM [Candidatus Acidoferrum sp.]
MARRPTSRRSTRGEVVLMSRSVFCSICGVSEHELASWEREDLVAPARIERVHGRVEALYDRDALRRVRVIRTLGEELEVNIPGIGVILHLLDQMER